MDFLKNWFASQNWTELGWTFGFGFTVVMVFLIYSEFKGSTWDPLSSSVPQRGNLGEKGKKGKKNKKNKKNKSKKMEREALRGSWVSVTEKTTVSRPSGGASESSSEDSLGEEDVSDAPPSPPVLRIVPKEDHRQEELIAALVSLGYKTRESKAVATQIVAASSADDSVEDLLKTALKGFRS